MPAERRRQIGELIRGAGSVAVADLEKRFGVSPMTARRDLSVLEEEGKVQRTHGGAVLPGFVGHEDSFQSRLEENVSAKGRLARAAVDLLGVGETVFVDSSTTSHYAARLILQDNIRATLLTNLVPTMGLFGTYQGPNAELIGMGGSLRKLTLSLVGPHAVATIRTHFADKAFISVKGITPEGYLTDPDPLEAEVKRAMIERSEEAVLLVDGRKFEQRGLNAIAHVSDLAVVLAADASQDRLEQLTEAGARRVRSV